MELLVIDWLNKHDWVVAAVIAAIAISFVASAAMELTRLWPT